MLPSERASERQRREEDAELESSPPASRCSLFSLFFLAKVASFDSAAIIISRSLSRNALTDRGSCDTALPRARSDEIRCGGREVGGRRCSSGRCCRATPRHGARSSFPSRSRPPLRPVSPCLGLESGSSDRSRTRGPLVCARARERKSNATRGEQKRRVVAFVSPPNGAFFFFV